ncbi:MAG: DUF5611 family protein [Halobacteriota archaeon]
MIAVQEYVFKRGFKKGAQKRILEALKDCFGVDVEERDEDYVLSYGALQKLTVRVSDALLVETEATKDVSDELIVDTNARFRCFLEKATGYTAKQRAKKAQEAVKGAQQT